MNERPAAVRRRLSVLLRKAAFAASGRIALMDAVRDFAYQWAWRHLRALKSGARILDIGSRASPFPAFLAWRGFAVSIVEKDPRFIDVQQGICARWRVSCDISTTDLLDVGESIRYDGLCAVFSLQHAGDNDVACYEKACRLLAAGGELVTVNQYSAEATKWHRGRDDGDMRIYGSADVEERIERPIIDGGLAIIEKRFAAADFGSGRIRWIRAQSARDATVVCIAARKT